MHKKTTLFLNMRILLVLLILAFFAGCSDDDDDKGSTAQPGSLEKLWSNPVIQGCGTCHGPNDQKDGPDLTTKANFYANLVGKSRDNYPNWFTTATPCTGTYVVPFSVKDSSVLSVISTQNGTTCSAYNYHTTQGGVITGAVLNDFILWIESGAPAN